jgi:hypothetical protein
MKDPAVAVQRTMGSASPGHFLEKAISKREQKAWRVQGEAGLSRGHSK